MSNLKIGDKLIYGSQGIMTLTDERYETIGDEKRLYYVLSGADTASAALTFVPKDNEHLASLMKPLLTSEALCEVLAGFDKSSVPAWNDSSRQRQDAFKRVLESGSRTDILGVIYLIRESGKRRLDEGKKNFLSDENVLKRAEKMLSDEIMLVLGVSAEEAMKMIDNAIE